uniref:Uncharacterized protein n=1 Tax=Thermofilum pendens TaxID=2269 RepID=A0A7C3WVP8_THEPE
MATALIEVVLAGTDEKVEFMLRSGETAELAIVNKDPHHVVCKVFVESVDGLLSSIMAIEVGGQRLYLGKSSEAGKNIMTEIRPGGAGILRMRYIAPPSGVDKAHVKIRIELQAPSPSALQRAEKQTTQELLLASVHEKS